MSRPAQFQRSFSMTIPLLRPAPRTHAFTLIELLVVIAIIALLVGILLPTLAGSRRVARQLKCATQQNQIFKAFIGYANDSKEYHHAKRQNWGARVVKINPSGPVDPLNLRAVRPYILAAEQQDYAYWGVIYDPYLGIEIQPEWYQGRAPMPVGGWQVWSCPDAKAMDPYPGSPFNPMNLYQTYGFNGVVPSSPKTQTWWKSSQGSFGGYRPSRISDVAAPADLIVFQDAFEHMLDANGDTLNDLSQYNQESRDGEAEFVDWHREYFRHGQGCVTTWGDGHTRIIGTAENNPSLPWYTGIRVGTP